MQHIFHAVRVSFSNPWRFLVGHSIARALSNNTDKVPSEQQKKWSTPYRCSTSQVMMM